MTDIASAAAAARLHAVLQHAPTAMAFVRDAHYQGMSEHCRRLLAWDDAHAAEGAPLQSMFPSSGALQQCMERLAQCLAQGIPLRAELELQRHDGSRFWADVQAWPVSPEDVSTTLWVLHDVSEARALRMQPNWIARHDPVTELANRREFARRLTDHVGSRRREPVSVLYIDLDRFARIVDKQGREVSDHYLNELGQLLVRTFRTSDLVARLDADHFAVLLPNCDQHFGELVAQKVRSAIASHRLHWGLHRDRITASVGAVQVQGALDTVEAVLGAAELACTEAKAAGGNCVRLFVPEGSYDEITSKL
ncbi:GGDEF domain-containing protein [Roseateles sp. BYS180W]|uniref:GGDEF domain-containing protein n=1 Tax=Roseateles rivi TaxID=3299028 RepID=A0ABW7FSJ1_9BURK